jgi:hypothetical protein
MQIRFEGSQKQHDDYECPHGGTLSNPRPVMLRPITIKVQIAAMETITARRRAYLARCGGLLGMRSAPGLLLVGHTVLLRHSDLKHPAFRVACIVRVQNANILFRAGTVTTCRLPKKSCACASLVFLQGSPPWPCATVVSFPSGYRKGNPQNHISCARNEQPLATSCCGSLRMPSLRSLKLI